MAVEILSEVDRFIGPPEAAGAALVAGVFVFTDDELSA
jgi:hypothetical protein